MGYGHFHFYRCAYGSFLLAILFAPLFFHLHFQVFSQITRHLVSLLEACHSLGYHHASFPCYLALVGPIRLHLQVC